MIDKDKLKELASDPAKSTKDVFTALGFNNYATWSAHLKKDPEAQQVFEAARSVAADLKGQSATLVAPPSGGKGAQPKAPKSQKRPATNGHVNGRVSDELLRKIKHEFEHISLYDQVSEFFDDVAASLATVK